MKLSRNVALLMWSLVIVASLTSCGLQRRAQWHYNRLQALSPESVKDSTVPFDTTVRVEGRKGKVAIRSVVGSSARVNGVKLTTVTPCDTNGMVVYVECPDSSLQVKGEIPVHYFCPPFEVPPDKTLLPSWLFYLMLCGNIIAAVVWFSRAVLPRIINGI